MTVVVFGSINMDLVAQTPRLPAPGETITGRNFFTVPGGKGANQAVACARLGAPTRMVGRVGSDVFSQTLLETLRGYSVDVSGVEATPDTPSGVAVIAVDDRAENTIIIVPGANGAVGPDDVKRLDGALERASVLLLQFEVPLESVVAAAQLARQRGIQVILDPAPALPLPSELYAAVDVITPNETEAALLVGFPVQSETDAVRAAEALVERGLLRVVIKMGSKGAYWVDATTGAPQGQFFPAFPVQAVDTVAAGDAFNGALATALSEGKAFAEAIRWGAAAGALSTTKAGAQPSMPEREAVMALLAR